MQTPLREIDTSPGEFVVEPCSDAAQADWDAFLERQPLGSFYHLYAWSKINQQALGHRSFYLVCRERGDPGAIAGVLPLTLVKSRLFGRILCSLPFVNFGGPCATSNRASEALVSRAVELADELRVDYLELRTRNTIERGLPCSLNKVSMSIELDADPDVLWNKFASSHRTAIRRARKNGLETRSGGKELLDDFYSAMESSWHRLGTPLYSCAYFERILDTFPNNTRIFACMQGTELIAVAFNGEFNGVIEGIWAAGGPRARELQANYVLYWDMIHDACARGFKRYHLGRSSADSGAADFKKKWNASSEQLYWYFHRKGGGPMPALNVSNPKYQLAITAWRKLPLGVVRAISPHLARLIP